MPGVKTAGDGCPLPTQSHLLAGAAAAAWPPADQAAEGRAAGAGWHLLSPALPLPTAGAVAAGPLGDLRR